MASESDGYRTPQSGVEDENNLSAEQEPAKYSITKAINILVTGNTSIVDMVDTNI